MRKGSFLPPFSLRTILKSHPEIYIYSSMPTDLQIPKTARTLVDPFQEFLPVLWNPAHPEDTDSIDGIYSIKRNHGVHGTFKLHNPNDAINDDRPASEKILIEYIINGVSYAIVRVADLLNSPFPIDHASGGNLIGDIAERIARRVTKYFLKHWNKRGYTGGVFDNRFDPLNRDDFIVAHTSDFILKIDRYPNLIILKRTGRGKFGYENIKELDGFFDYRFGGKRYILVLESKLEKINVNCDDLVNNLFAPLRQIFPDAQFYYVLFTDKNSIYVKNTFRSWRQIKQLPLKIHETALRSGNRYDFLQLQRKPRRFRAHEGFSDHAGARGAQAGGHAAGQDRDYRQGAAGI